MTRIQGLQRAQRVQPFAHVALGAEHGLHGLGFGQAPAFEDVALGVGQVICSGKKCSTGLLY